MCGLSLAAVYKEYFISEVVCVCVCEIVPTCQCNMTPRKRNKIGFRTEEQLAKAVGVHGVDTADQYLAYYAFIRKTVKWPKKVFFYLLQCCLFNSYVTFSKNNPNSRKSFLDFMSDIT